MQYLLVVLLILSVKAFGADLCKLDEKIFETDLKKNVRSLFAVPADRRVEFSSDIDKDLPDPKEAVILLEMLWVDHIFDEPRPDPTDPCPDRINRIYQVLEQDELRKCNAILLSELTSHTYSIIYRHCTIN